MQKQRKWVIITGGVLSGLGKGIVSASIGRILCSKYKVVPLKCDGYLNVDPGTMNPIEHGEVFVLDDGGEVDMDFGHYERFINTDCKFNWNLTSGKIFKYVIDKERRGDFLGKTVQMIPHVTDEIKTRFFKIAEDEDADIMLIEIGGTVGDIENMLFIEAVRQLKHEVGRENIIYVHLTLVPVLNVVGEEKTKPTQQSVALLQQRGIQPDIVVGRSNSIISERGKKKIALFANIDTRDVISDPDISTVYELPLIFGKEGLIDALKFKLDLRDLSDLKDWTKLVQNIKNPTKEITIALCGKYTDLQDSYISISEALTHVGAHLQIKINTRFIESTEIEEGTVKLDEIMQEVTGLIVPGGFGDRGVEGKIAAIRYARENNIPFLGLCYGMQLAVVEFARHICGLADAHTTEVQTTNNPVIDILPEQEAIEDKGGTMRLGAYKAVLKEGTKVQKIYDTDVVFERHRHRYEVNPEYHQTLTQNGMVFSGTSEDGLLVEFMELPNHPFFIGTQAHPELKSRLERPAPIFMEFVKSCIK